MNRRNMIKAGIAGLLGFSIEGKAAGAEIEEERTLDYLRQIPVWNEKDVFKFFDEKEYNAREFLFTAGFERDSLLEMYEENGYALIYSPRWIIQKGHFFDILFVKIGDKNVTAITELKGMKKKLPDCINMIGEKNNNA